MNILYVMNVDRLSIIKDKFYNKFIKFEFE